ncbi:type II toxin-antitoxin system VapC family toxin [Halorhodospira sp. 9621]|uniref:type II toxin-antitoxin system VapC family toxin n=1 Tax=Halorhodospira TaxID=85108 RepID=UPI001911A5F4|nr:MULTISPECIES: type II toxin-antitoxin system VapC family toxin [Halorhodospira]MBK5944715.1 VapC toxin family PIN domain ribonuclease [Halorhodospira halophila]MCG5528857.1 type II toxin-antitoxin system VapC family toxin [Halorhodospira halophila]MCG5533639.1 type II toxin-antitoxin system VapC family toxin [Halorhodospira sp. 9621]MCG5539415.1 type II toxin-antitoxin system VapC family toxin [Halorhodospira sp. 9622]MCG5544243.1 type II toxin-antitoxin system VapC family toxin [Halorhodos
MIVLDTHALLWWANGDDQLSPHALAAIEHEMQADDGEVLISAISAWEIALLVEKGRLTLSMTTSDWLDTVEEIEGVRFIALDAATAVESTRLPGEFHKDPADRMIVALARRFNAELITADEKITAYRHVKTIW